MGEDLSPAASALRINVYSSAVAMGMIEKLVGGSVDGGSRSRPECGR
jgi:hypothetical protein